MSRRTKSLVWILSLPFRLALEVVTLIILLVLTPLGLGILWVIVQNSSMPEEG